MNEYILRSESVYKSYRKSKFSNLEVLKGISINIKKDKITVIVGASGAGKSTLLHILGGLDFPDSGKVYVDEMDISKFSDDKLANFRALNFGFVFQFHHLLPEFTALENAAMPLMIAGKSFSTASKRAKELLELVNLTDRANHKPAELSGGEQQRVAVARALANDPKIILADEPTGNLDSENSEIISSLFVELKNKFNKTFIIVTHNPELMKIGEESFEIKDGKLLI